MDSIIVHRGRRKKRNAPDSHASRRRLEADRGYARQYSTEPGFDGVAWNMSSTPRLPHQRILARLLKSYQEYFEGNPSKVSSPRSTSAKDTTVKHRIYERSGVREYRIADPANRVVHRIVLRDGKFGDAVSHVYDERHVEPVPASVLEGLSVDSCGLRNTPSSVITASDEPEDPVSRSRFPPDK